jgi:DNA-binding protein HU-beta
LKTGDARIAIQGEITYKVPVFSQRQIIEDVIYMNKSELIDAVASAADLSKADATRATDAVLDSIIATLGKGDQVNLIGFGTFSVRERAARAGRNPQTGETIQIKASKSPGFKAGKAFKDAVN